MVNRRAFLTASGALAYACVSRRRIAPVPGPQRGVAFDAFQAAPHVGDFAAIKELGASHVAFFPFAYMHGHMEPRVFRYEGPHVDWSLTDEGLLSLGSMAREAGLDVLIVPTLADFTDGHWRGEVRMADEDSWTVWFESYRTFVIHYADIAEEMRASGFSVGTELRETVSRVGQWIEIIDAVRERFRGWITYAANWDDYDLVPWWHRLDLIGVQAYFELGDPGSGPRDERRERLIRAWDPIKAKLAALSRATGKRILFTEIGYKSHSLATVEPWRWEIEGVADATLQAAAYEAAFDSFWTQPWFAGFYWWKWRPNPGEDRDYDRDFTPQGKAAEVVLRRYYCGE